MPDKDKNDNVDHKKMLKEEDLEEKVVEMLIKEYGYSKSQIHAPYPVPGTNLELDVVVFDPSSIHAERNAPLIVIEIKKDGLFLPHDKNQLLKYVNAAHAKFGVLYDGEHKFCYTKLDPKTFVDVVDIPPVKSFKRPSVTGGEAHIPVTTALNNILKSFRGNRQYAQYEKYLPHILAMFISRVRKPIDFQDTVVDVEWDVEHIPDSFPLDETYSQPEYPKVEDTSNIIKKLISQTKREFRFLQWEEFEEEFDKIEARSNEYWKIDEWNKHVLEMQELSIDEKLSKMKMYGKTKEQIAELPKAEKLKIMSSRYYAVPEEIWYPDKSPLYQIINELDGFILSSVTLERAIHDVLVEYTQSSPAAHKGAEGGYFTPDVLIKFSLELLQPKKGKKLLIADPLISLLTVKHFLSARFELENSSLNDYVKKNITAISNRAPNSINQFEMMLPEFNLKVDDPIKVMEGLGMFDYVFSSGYFGMKLAEFHEVYKKEFGDFGNELENYRILSLLKHVNPKGTLALVLPSGFLFRDSGKKI